VEHRGLSALTPSWLYIRRGAIGRALRPDRLNAHVLEEDDCPIITSSVRRNGASMTTSESAFMSPHMHATNTKTINIITYVLQKDFESTVHGRSGLKQ
jgi:hypothetical protein